MRQARLKLGGTTAVYHCVTRTVGGSMLLGRREKEVLRKMLWKVAAFSGVQVLSYCVMSNHFHVLVRVDERVPLSREELIARYRVLYRNSTSPTHPDPEVLALILAEDSEEAQNWVDRLSVRMSDVSEFMKTLKQRFSIWYNKTHERYGTLWAERFKSTLVENDPTALKVVAAYIDLNPVRAGMVEDPAEYRWSSYGEALGGLESARAGLCGVIDESDWNRTVECYRMVLYGKGAVGRTGEQGVIPREIALKVLAGGGKVPRSSLLRCRIRYLTDGAIFGSREFVQQTAAELRMGGLTSDRPRIPSPLPDDETDGLVAWRRLRLSPID